MKIDITIYDGKQKGNHLDHKRDPAQSLPLR